MTDQEATKEKTAANYDDLFATLRRRAISAGFGSLSSAEQTFHAVAVLRSDLALGAFPLFFDCADERVQRAVGAALSDLGRPDLVDLVDQARKLWEADAAWKAEVDAERGLVPPNEARLAELTDRFLEADDELAQRLAQWARARRLIAR